MTQLDIQSSKIKCAGCVSNIEKGLHVFSGITEVKVDIESNIINIQGDNLDESSIRKKLTELGYPSIE